MNCNQPGVHGPVVVVHPEGVWYDGLKPEDIDEYLEIVDFGETREYIKRICAGYGIYQFLDGK